MTFLEREAAGKALAASEGVKWTSLDGDQRIAYCDKATKPQTRVHFVNGAVVDVRNFRIFGVAGVSRAEFTFTQGAMKGQTRCYRMSRITKYENLN